MLRELSKSKIFLYTCIAFIIGVALASFLPKERLANDLYWFMAAAAVFIIAFFSWPKRKFGVIALLGLFLILGVWRYAIYLAPLTPDRIAYYNGQAAAVTGVVAGEPDVRENNVKYEIDAKNVRLGFKNQPNIGVNGKLLATAGLYPRYHYGDELEIECDLVAPEPFSGFAYDRYLARWGIHSLCYYPKITVIGSGGGSWLYARLFRVKEGARGLINRGLSEPEASLARAMVLGDKRGLPESMRSVFSQAGLSHIVAISGMHISILAAMAMAILMAAGLRRGQAFYLASLLLLGYIFLIGLPASAVRAGIMGFLVLLAMNIGRLNRLSNSLALAAALMLLINPSLLRDDVGFQLSFLAVLGIAFGYPLIDRLGDNIKPIPKTVRDIVAITLAAQIFTLPVIALNFSQVSLIAPLANLLVLWTLPVVMVAILGALGLSYILPGLAFTWFLPGLILLKYIILTAEFMIKLPYSYIKIDYLWLGWAVLYYIVLIWLIIKLKKQPVLAELNKKGK